LHFLLGDLVLAHQFVVLEFVEFDLFDRRFVAGLHFLDLLVELRCLLCVIQDLRFERVEDRAIRAALPLSLAFGALRFAFAFR
jgi:hypothetical protein